MDMLELREYVKRYPNKQAIVTVEILDDGDVIMMQTWYKKHALPKVTAAFREYGNIFNEEKADNLLARESSVRSGTNGIIPLEELPREKLKMFLDEVKVYCATNLSLVL
jgi:hypothetical protein